MGTVRLAARSGRLDDIVVLAGVGCKHLGTITVAAVSACDQHLAPTNDSDYVHSRVRVCDGNAFSCSTGCVDH